MSRSKRILQNSLLLFFSICFALVILEVFLRVVLYKNANKHFSKQQALRRETEFVFFEYDQFLGWKNKPLAEGYLTIPDSKTFVKINSKGLRDREHSYSRKRGIFRILALGDSFTWGYGVDLEDAFVKKLDVFLGDKFEVINAGVAAYGTDQELVYLEKEGLKYKPDVILVNFANNDFRWDNHADKHGYYPKPRFILENEQLRLANVPLPDFKGDKWEALVQKQASDLEGHGAKDTKTKKRGFKAFLKRNTKVYPVLSKSLKSLRYKLLRKLRTIPKIGRAFSKMRLSFDDDKVDLEITKAMFLKIKEDAAAIGAEMAVFIIPYRSALEKLPDPGINEFIEFFKQNGIPCLYPYERFLQESQKGRKLFFDHDDHWSTEGHLIAAEEIHSFLKKERLIHK